MFNSPLDWCPIAKCYVALDEPQVQCAARNHCVTERCPLACYFFAPAQNGDAHVEQSACSEDPAVIEAG